MDPAVTIAIGISLFALILALAFRRLNQPLILAYLLAGVLLGPHALGLVQEYEILSGLGELGVILLLFFLGMEISLPKLVERWRIPVGGTALQVLVSTGLVIALGILLDWPLRRSVLIGFVISLSSTVVVLRLLEDRKETGTRMGQDVLGVLLAQDLALVPMLLVISLLGGGAVNPSALALQIVVGGLLIAAVAYSVRYQRLRIPFARMVRADHELQLLGALVLCFGLAFIAGAAGLSPAFGAFVGGILVSGAKEAQWVRSTLHDFKVLFVALFFVSIGMLLDLQFLMAYLPLLLGLACIVLFTNTFINASILRALGEPWRESIFFGSLLSQIGEFSFVLAGAGLAAGVIAGFAYQATVNVIALTLLLSPLWILATRRLLRL